MDRKILAKTTVVLITSSALIALLVTGDSGVVIVNGEPLQTGPIPVWLVELMYAPKDWVVPAIMGTGAIVLSVAYIGYRRSGIDAQVKREAASNGTIVCSMGALTAALTSLFPYWAAVPLGSAIGFIGGVKAAEWLGL